MLVLHIHLVLFTTLVHGYMVEEPEADDMLPMFWYGVMTASRPSFKSIFQEDDMELVSKIRFVFGSCCPCASVLHRFFSFLFF